MTACAGLCLSVPFAGPVMSSSALACEPAALREQVAMLVEKKVLLEKQVRRLQEKIQDLRRQVHRDSSNSGQSPSQDGPGHRRRSLHCGTGRRPPAAGPSRPHPPSGGSLPSRHSWPYPLRVTCSSRQYRHRRICHRHCLHAFARTRMFHRCSLHDKPPTHGCLRFCNRMRSHPRKGTPPLLY